MDKDDADGYYSEDDMGEDKLDLSFLDDDKSASEPDESDKKDNAKE